MKQGQVIITDILIAVGLSVVVLAFLLVTLNYYNQKLAYDIEFTDMHNKALYIADFLAFSPGVPSNWSPTSFILPGVAAEDRRVSYPKLLNFSQTDKMQVKDAFKIRQYNYSLIMYYQHNNTPIVGAGETWAGQSNISAASRRIVIYGNETAYIDFIIWR